MTLKNIDKSYKIKIINNQTIDGEAAAVTEQTTGSCVRKNGKTYIRYNTVDEGAETATAVIIGEAVTVKRSGAISSVMEFKEGSDTELLYRTPYGAIAMKISTKTLGAEFDDKGGILKIRYTLTVQGDIYENDMTIIVTEGDTDEI